MKNEARSQKPGAGSEKEVEKMRSLEVKEKISTSQPLNLSTSGLLLLLTVFCLLLTIFPGCGKKDETQVSVAEKKVDVATSTENIPAEFAEAYKNVLVVSTVEGVDWQKGIITATGRGLPPKDISNPAQAKILAMRAAKVEAYKNLLETILKMKTPPDRGMKEYLDEKRIEISRIEGFVKGARVVKEEYKNDGSAEVMLELPIAGGYGLVAILK